MRVNYTTYDMRRGQDSVNPRTQADIMILAMKIQRCAIRTHTVTHGSLVYSMHMLYGWVIRVVSSGLTSYGYGGLVVNYPKGPVSKHVGYLE